MERICRRRGNRFFRRTAGLAVALTLVANLASAGETVGVRVARLPGAPLPGLALGSPAALRKAFPAAQLVQVSPAEYERLRRKFRMEGREVIDLPLMQLTPAEQREAEQREEEAKRKKGEEERQRQAEEASEREFAEPDGPGFNFGLNLDLPVGGGGGSGNDGGAIILFVLIGIFVVAFVLVASVTIAYDVLVRGKPYPGFSSLEAGYSYFNFEEQNAQGRVESVESGTLASLRMDLGVTKPGKFGVGLAGEVGAMSGFLSVQGVKSFELEGVYGMVGPVIQFAQGVFQMELLAGSNFQSGVGVMSAARLRLRLPLGFSQLGKGGPVSFHGAYLGLSWGSIYINLKQEKGLIQDKGQFNELYGASLGFSF